MGLVFMEGGAELIASVHLAVGSAGALCVDRCLPLPVGPRLKLMIVFVAGLATHIILDAFPHQEYLERWPWPWVISETILVMVLVLSARHGFRGNSVLFIGMSGAAFPDLLHICRNGFFRSLDIFHSFHGDIPLPFLVPMLWQVFLALLAILYIRNKTAA